jgi:hypothetical protein
MNKIELLHGTDHIIEVPDITKGNPKNDYGMGFYCTRLPEMAKEWAVSEEHDGYANRYELELEGMKILNLNRDHSILTWLTVLIQNRTFNVDTPLAAEFSRYLQENFCVDTTNYDLIVGYRADDSYFSFAQDFLSGAISYQQLCRAMYLGELGEQVVLISPAAFSAIHYVGCEEALRSDWLHRKTERDRRARTEYLQSDRMRFRRGELYAAAILDEEIRPDDPRLMRVKI